MPIDYVAIGPIFETSTKQASHRAVGLEGLRLAREAIGNVPLVAIGGITLENSLQVLAAGCDALAVISDIWISAEQASTQTRRLLHKR
jgi:thiamine-phosphate pyrophosphorylase